MLFVAVNSSVMKRTLSSNNRALARALEMKKAELNAAFERITALRTENHALLAEVNRLKSYNGTGGEISEQEINERVAVSFKLKYILSIFRYKCND